MHIIFSPLLSPFYVDNKTARHGHSLHLKAKGPNKFICCINIADTSIIPTRRAQVLFGGQKAGYKYSLLWKLPDNHRTVTTSLYGRDSKHFSILVNQVASKTFPSLSGSIFLAKHLDATPQLEVLTTVSANILCGY